MRLSGSAGDAHSWLETFLPLRFLSKRGTHRNPALCRLLGMATEDDIPHGWNLSRFLDVLGQEPHLTALRQVFDTLARRLATAVPDLGRHTAGDATALAGRAKTDPKAVRAE